MFDEINDTSIAVSMDEKTSATMTKIVQPDQLYIFPLIRRPFFPGMATPVVIEQGIFYEVLKSVVRSDHKSIGLVMTKSEDVDNTKLTLDDCHTVGVLAKVLRVVPIDQGSAQVILSMEKRITLLGEGSDDKHLHAKVMYHEDDLTNSDELKAYAINIISIVKELLKLNPFFKEDMQIFIGHSDFSDPGKLADFAAALTTATRDELQDVLNTFDVKFRTDKALVLLKKELDLSILQHTINQKLEATITKNQRDYFLKEQLKTIKKELGIERDDKLVEKEKYEARLKERKAPPHVEKVIHDELEKMNILDVHSAEYAVSRNYLDWLTVIPWGIHSQENHHLAKARKILEEDHYGLEDIKERILEFIGVGKLSGGVKGSIICLVGPPGVGKTSIGKSIARALNRKFYRFSVGGMRDEAEIKGHRRTYIGAMPGKLIQALKLCQTMNPVIMLDEIDKIGNSYRGDPASALLEVLDPEQNREFLDHYLDVGCNLSDVLFIVTANVLDTIPEPLKDRMDILRLSGYIMQEKIEIAKKYLIPHHRKEMGLKTSQVDFTKESLKFLINGYAREAGVRTLENQIKKILRKTAIKIVQEQEKNEQLVNEREVTLPAKPKKNSKAAQAKETPLSFKITPDNLPEYLGKPKFNSDRFYEETPAGVATGLAWTALGGATLYIETIKVHSDKTEMKLTGQAGQVMKESSEIAWSYLHGALHKYAVGYPFFEKSQIHIHFPEGATPKDGPSAGITIVTALLSLLLDIPVTKDLGMTGEITLTGKVLPIGGVKEKVVAARRSGLKKLIFPKENMSDFEELPDYVKKGIEVHFVGDYHEVFPIAFPKNR